MVLLVKLAIVPAISGGLILRTVKGRDGNERNDDLTKLRGKKTQSENAFTYSEKRSVSSGHSIHSRKREITTIFLKETDKCRW